MPDMPASPLSVPGLTAWLRDWLVRTDSSCRGAIRTDYIAGETGTDVHTAMAQLIISARSDTRRTRRLLDKVGWTTAGARFRPSVQVVKRHGDFGEVLAIAIMAEFDDVDVPVVKLRYQIDPEQTQPGTDIVGFSFDSDGSISFLEFTEVKVRTSPNAQILREAHSQLLEDSLANFVETIDFLHQRMSDNRPDLVEAYDNYLADRREGSLQRYRISLAVDSELWKETWTDRLPDSDDMLTPLRIDIVRIDDLRQNIATSWDTVSAETFDKLTLSQAGPTSDRSSSDWSAS